MGGKLVSYEEFTVRAAAIHNGKYNYSNSNLVGTQHKVNITCPIHGEFMQLAYKHLLGAGCKQCAIESKAIMVRKGVNQLIEEFNMIHHNKYDYSKLVYINTHTKIEIICNTHGSFMQKPNDHLHGMGCHMCAITKSAHTTVHFSKQGSTVHHNKYDYSKVIYVNNHTKVVIICSTHGEFSQLPSNHLKGVGCPKCGAISRGASKLLSADQVIALANEAHSTKYTYDTTNYVNTSSKIAITCRDHGTFIQKVSNHIYSKQGCPRCTIGGRYSNHWFSLHPEFKTLSGILYILKFTKDTEQFWKIGITKRSIAKRWTNSNGYIITPVFALTDTLHTVFQIEQQILKSILYRRRYTPSIKIGGDAECFTLKDNDELTLPTLIQTINDVQHSLTNVGNKDS